MADGMTVGVLLRRLRDRSSPFGAMTAFFQRVAHEGRQLNLRVVGLGPEDLHRRRRRVEALLWDPRRSRFTGGELPLPDLVWNRLKGTSGGLAAAQLRELGVPLLNQVTLNKWEAVQVLSRDPVLRSRMPHTRLLGDPEDALEMVNRHGRAYLKPVVGSMGRGILRLLQANGRLLGQAVDRASGGVRSEVLKPRDLEDWLEQYTDGRRYLVQQGLHLEVFGGRTTDIRILVQKDGWGQWQITGMGARVGAPGRFTSNLHTGGTGIPVPKLLAALMPADPARQAEVMANIRQLCLHLCRVLEEAMGPLGELGIDIGLEPDGSLWYIEHNYYPGRSIFRHLGDHAAWLLAHRRPLEYAHWAVDRRRRGLPLLLPPEPPAPAEQGPPHGNPAARRPAVTLPVPRGPAAGAAAVASAPPAPEGAGDLPGHTPQGPEQPR